MTPSPRLNKFTYTFKMLRIPHNFFTFQNVANHGHSIFKKYGENINYFIWKGYGAHRALRWYLTHFLNLKPFVLSFWVPRATGVERHFKSYHEHVWKEHHYFHRMQVRQVPEFWKCWSLDHEEFKQKCFIWGRV